MVCQDLYQVTCTLEIMVSMAIGHDNSKHLLIVYGVVLLRWFYTPRPISNPVPVALASRLVFLLYVHSAFCSITDFILLLQDDTCNGKP
jgi:hypothetical protein